MQSRDKGTIFPKIFECNILLYGRTRAHFEGYLRILFRRRTSSFFQLFLTKYISAKENTNSLKSLSRHTTLIMDHCHEVSNQRLMDVGQARRKLIIACILCLIFVGSEITGGILSGSLAILTDAAHMFSDFASFIVGILVIHLGNKAAKKGYNFGFLRAEALGALFTVTVIWYVTGILLYLSIQRLYYQDFEVEPDTMMITGGIAVIFNLILGYVFHGHSHEKGDSANHSHVHINIRAALIHVIGDLVQSIGVFYIIHHNQIWPEYKIADPMCTVLFSIIVFCTTINILRDTLQILMEGVPKSIKYDEVMIDILDTSGNIVQVHDLCIWSLTTDKFALTAHIAINPSNREHDEALIKDVTSRLRIKYRQLSKITIQIEDYSSVMSSCGFCQSLES
ncbi:SLC30A2 [Lepeophtheirus salmonis]|uniref:SLC30A2 n=1 Tax=Lepeophtheirus salmonis TaxID=72036 RepID=A0A7R8CFW8_LEPSM|nr:SLC30A2 [Lepeophtheirus salmonis]CAF2806417.1 SLC30A2 [Lepeophtheirus salmonis]